MIRNGLGRAVDFVTDHNRITLLVMVLLSAVVLAGIPQVDTESEASPDSDAFDDLEAINKSTYISQHYREQQDRSNKTFETVYVWRTDGNALSKASLLDGLRYQQAVMENSSVQASLHSDGVLGISNLVAKRAAGNPNATLDQQIAALENASVATVEQLVGATLSKDPRAQRLLPSNHDGSSLTATGRRMLFTFDDRTDFETREKAEAALYREAQERADSGLFVLSNQAFDSYRSHFVSQMLQLVLPAALLFILVVLAFAYRDLVDVIVGMTGVVLSVLWMFGLLGWLGVAAGIVSIVPVVLVSGLSIDFGFHVFNRYREERGENEGIREPMGRGVTLVATALILVTVTAAIGFLANLTNPLPLIRNLGISITLGVVSALVIFGTVVPALKIGIDGLLERVGLDRRKRALGHGQYLRPILARSVTLARRGAPVVLALAILVGALGGAAWFALDEENFQQADGDVAEWKQQLPDPVGWQTHPVPKQQTHVENAYQPASAEDAVQEPILIQGDVTSPNTLEAIQAGIDGMEKSGVLIDQPGVQTVRSPLTAMQAVAERNDTFATILRNADTNGNGVPDRNLASVYDAFYAADADTAATVIERRNGQYRSILVTPSLGTDFSEATETVETLSAAADRMERGGDLTATVAGSFAINDAVLDKIVDGILTTMAIALVAILLTLTVVFYAMHGSASLGLVVSVPIALVLGMVIGGMYLLEIPLTLLTALLMSLVIGLGVDYNIHVGDRFADERRAGQSTFEALDAAVTGTGGALVGSTLTSAGAFATMTLVPHPQMQSFGSIVVVALITAFAVSVLVLPSMLVLWDRYSPETVTRESSAEGAVAQD